MSDNTFNEYCKGLCKTKCCAVRTERKPQSHWLQNSLEPDLIPSSWQQGSLVGPITNDSFCLVPSSGTCVITMGGKAGCRHWMIRKGLLDWLRVAKIKSNPNKHKRYKSISTPSATGQLPGPCQLLENSLLNKSPNYQLCELINQVTQCYVLEAGRKGVVHLR